MVEAEEKTEELFEAKKDLPGVTEKLLVIREGLFESCEELEESVDEKDVSIWKPQRY